MNRFADVEGVEELIGQAVGAGSMCWLPNTGSLEFDSAQASKIVDEVVERLSQITGGL